jgi:anti-anti-sigma regulatory factor
MLRITLDKNTRATSLRVEGRLTGPWVNELEQAWRAATSDPADGRVCVDLTDVTFIGEDGKQLLETMYAQGAKLKACGCANRRLIDEIGQTFNRAHPKQAVPTPE